ncbi:MAG: DUF1427 family protein [Micropepsaceae bacterium]
MRKLYKFGWGLAVAFAVGFSASRLGIAVPAPPALIGALLVLAMTLGYVWADYCLAPRPSTCRDMCGGPDGRKRSNHSNERRG